MFPSHDPVGYVDSTYFTNFDSLDIIKAKADTANINLEYLIASSWYL